jgi:hypothetical protein
MTDYAVPPPELVQQWVAEIWHEGTPVRVALSDAHWRHCPMTESNFRALCAELVDELQGYKVAHPMHCRALLNRARAALAQPEPQGPTDEELWDLYQDLGRDFSPTEFARTVLARWGRPAIEPVP